MKKYDAIVIGSGKGGRTLATDLAKLGKEVAIVETSDKMYGGVCVNEGCIPTKILVNRAQHSAAQGGMFIEQASRYTAAIQEKDFLVASLREKCYFGLKEYENITVLTGHASFVSEHIVEVQSDQETIRIEGEFIFINTGATPVIPSIPGLASSRYVHTSATMLKVKELPRRIVIIGGGYTGLEFASIYTNFGSQVTIVEASDVFLPHEDEEIAEAVADSLRRREVQIMLSSTVSKVEDVRGCALLTIQTPVGEELLYADTVLIAVGRKPNVEGLNLMRAGIALSTKGGILVNERLHTTAAGVWALGDVTGGEQFSPLSLDDARIIKSDLLGDRKRTVNNRGEIPYCVFVDPAFTRVGMTEKEARGRGFSVKIARMHAKDCSSARILGNQWGLFKAVIDANTNKILGMHLFGAMAHETINLAKIAMDMGMPYTALRDNIFTHPTMAEAFNELFENLE